MATPLRAVPLDQSGASEVTGSRRHRPVAVASLVERMGTQEADDRDASELITLLADALEKVAETTTDAAARAIAEDALALFQGR